MFGGGDGGGSTAVGLSFGSSGLSPPLPPLSSVLFMLNTQPPRRFASEGLVSELKSGTVLSCQDLVVQVLLPQWVLTSVFGMGTGGSPTP
jgi:hypothetical protein